jgi:large subunit ribosomal protein L25
MTEEEYMTSQDISLDLQERTVVRKRLAGLRQEGLVPAVIHNHGKESLHVAGDSTQLTKVYYQAGKHHPVNLTVAGKKHLALIKGVDFGPAKHEVRHVVFQAIRQNEETEAQIPVVFKEDVEIPAEKKSLMVLQQLDTVQVKALPRDLPDQIVVDPSSLADVGDSLSVADLVMPNGVTLLTESEHQIAIVEMPKDQIAEANAAQEALAEDAGKPDAETAEEAAAPASEKEANTDKTEEE